jgi:medium-chain acyl-[acyl-carrier-protein] hydrolase
VKPDRTPRWFQPLRSGGRTQHRIFCFPYAGGGASVYRRLAREVQPGVEFCAVQLPGREERFTEAPLNRIAAAIPPLVHELQALTGVPFSFFGHSMGSLMAFELARELRRRGLAMPQHLFLSGRRAPHLPDRRRPLHGLPAAELHAELRDLQGTPPAVLDDPELMQLLEPVLRADFELCESYRYTPEAPLDVSLRVFGGSDDREATKGELEAWREHSGKFSGVRMFSGHHFYLLDQWSALARTMADALTLERSAR